MSAEVVITGASGGVATRLEINTFVRNEKFFSLYIQALQAMQNTDQSNYESFFQIAGIHGLPYEPWAGAVGDRDPRTTWGGYCVHGSTLFPTWHRPYMMLYEQVLHKHALAVAETYTVDKEEWVAAANALRQPYWDWAANAVPPPEVISLAQVPIIGPTGESITVNNPLFQYRFHPVDSSFRGTFRSWPATLRQPTNNRPNAQTNITRLQRVLQAAQNDITLSTYNMLTRVRQWRSFASHTVGDGGSASNSIEAIHDSIHVYLGGNGHMSDPSVAAFDPIFFLHHANVDRMISLWSALNPGVWVADGDSEDGSFTLAPEVPVNAATPLTPFWKGEDSFWTSNDTVDTAKLGYTYPEFASLDLGNRIAVRTAIANIVNRLYGRVFTGFEASAVQPEARVAAEVQAAPEPVVAAEAAVEAEVQEAAPPVAEEVAAVEAEAEVQPEAQVAEAVEEAVVNTEEAVPVEAEVRTRSLAVVNTEEEVAVEAEVTNAEVRTRSFAAERSIPRGVPHPSQVPVHHIINAPNCGLWDWTARVEFKKYELGTSFSVVLFFGAIPEDTDDWLISETFVGAHHAFVNSAAGNCANCRNSSGLVEEGFVHLDRAIIDQSGLHSFEPEVVIPYLTENLQWRVVKTDGEIAELESLEVSIIATPLSYPPGTLFPVPGEPHRYDRITRGRTGGSRHPPGE